MGYILDEWKSLLEAFQNSVEKDLEEIHQQKSEMQQIKEDIVSRLDRVRYVRDEDCLILSAPRIVIGNVDKNGELLGGGIGEVTIRGNGVALEGVGDSGHIVSRAPSIRQLAVDPGIDGVENVVRPTSEIVAQACGIALQSNDAKDAFSMPPATAVKGGITIHADQDLSIEAAVSAAGRKKTIENTVAALSKQATDLKKQMGEQKKGLEASFKTLAKLLDQEDKINQEDDFLNRVSLNDIGDIHESINDLAPVICNSTMQFIRLVSQLCEVNRQKKALEAEKGKIKDGDAFKKNSTGASMRIVAESINVATTDGDGNLHTNAGAGISVRTPNFNVNMLDDTSKLTKDSFFSVSSENISLSAVAPNQEELPVSGNVSIQSKNISIEAIDYSLDDKKGVKEKKLADDSKIAITAKTIEVATTSPKDVERDGKGKLTKGEYTAEGDVFIRSKNVSVESLDYEVKDGKLKPKTLVKGGQLALRAEKMGLNAVDAEGKATGSININAKAVSVKSMDVDKEKLTDDKLAGGSTMTLVSEKMYVGAKSKSVKSKKIQAMSDEIGAFADKTLEIQQDGGKALVQLSGGNASMGGSKSQIYGATTINGKAEVKGDLKAPKGQFDNLEAKTSFKSQNISDGFAIPGAPGGGSLSAKLKTEDAPKD